MAVSKVYERTYFVNGKNGGTPLNGAPSKEQAMSQVIGTLNKIDYGLDEIDTRVVEISNQRYDSRDYALQSQSYATGDAFYDDEKTEPYRENQETDNSKYYYQQTQEIYNSIGNVIEQAEEYANDAKTYAEYAEESANIASQSAESALSSLTASVTASENASQSAQNAKDSEDNVNAIKSAVDEDILVIQGLKESAETAANTATEMAKLAEEKTANASFELNLSDGCLYYLSED